MDQDRLDELIDKYASGTISSEELRELLDWYHSVKIATVEWPADGPEEKEQLKERMLLRLQTQIRALPEIPARRRIFRVRAWQVAACLAIVFSSIWIARQYSGLTGKPAWVAVTNPSGKIQAIRLPDGSEVWLNAASTIRYSPDLGKGHDATRAIDLEGEGYFEVGEDPAHPFVVRTGSLMTTVLGTRFDVKAFRDERLTSVSVISGKVRVQDTARVLDVLTAALQLRVDARSGNSTTVTIDTTAVLGWRWGKLQFPGQTMEEIAASLSRWYNIHFTFADPSIGRCRYYLNFENTISLQQMLKALRETTDLNFQEDVARHTVVISGIGCH
jgi:transmembrane sensor